MKIAVVGSGIVGKLVSLHLADAGCEVWQIYEDQKDRCASYAAHGVLTVRGEIKARDSIYALHCQQIESYGKFLEKIEQRSGVNIPKIHGVYESVADDADYKRIKRRVYQQRFTGLFRSNYICNKDIFKSKKDIFSSMPVQTKNIGWMHYPKDMWMDPVCLLEALSVILNKRTKTIRKQVKKIQYTKNISVVFDGHSMDFDKIVLATGAQTKKLLEESKIDFKPKLKNLGGCSLRINKCFFREDSFALIKKKINIAKNKNNCVLGSFSYTPGDDQKEKEAIASLKKQALQIQTLCSSKAQVLRGERVYLPSRRPFSGPLESASADIWLITGFYKRGFSLANVYAQELVKKLL
jgi:glycine/D-amino acid oxidase-like deaminating enzyme